MTGFQVHKTIHRIFKRRERGHSIWNFYFCRKNSKIYFIMFIHKLFVFHHNVKMTSTELKLRLSCFKLLYRNLILLRVIYPSQLKVLLERTLSTHGRLEPKWFFYENTFLSFWTWRRKVSLHFLIILLNTKAYLDIFLRYRKRKKELVLPNNTRLIDCERWGCIRETMEWIFFQK